MKKSELVNRIHAQKPLLFRYQVEKLVTAILDEIASAIARGDRVELDAAYCLGNRHSGLTQTKRRPRLVWDG